MKRCCFKEKVPKQLLKVPWCWPTEINDHLDDWCSWMTAYRPFLLHWIILRTVKLYKPTQACLSPIPLYCTRKFFILGGLLVLLKRKRRQPACCQPGYGLRYRWEKIRFVSHWKWRVSLSRMCCKSYSISDGLQQEFSVCKVVRLIMFA